MDAAKTQRPSTAAIVNTFLKVLAEHPDTFISRKVGKEKAREVSADAKEMLDLGGVETAKGKESLIEFDKKLRKAGNDYQPWNNSRYYCCSISLATLSGYRP